MPKFRYAMWKTWKYFFKKCGQLADFLKNDELIVDNFEILKMFHVKHFYLQKKKFKKNQNIFWIRCHCEILFGYKKWRLKTKLKNNFKIIFETMFHVKHWKAFYKNIVLKKCKIAPDREFQMRHKKYSLKNAEIDL